MVALNLTLPRRTPSPRNLEIYSQVKIHGRSQSQVAADRKLTQSRVARIIAQVEQWRATSDAAEGPLSNTERRRHERWLARERWEAIYQRSLAELDASARPLTSERSGTRDGKPFQETTQREQATSVQWMKTAIRAAENLVKLSELEPLAKPDTDQERREQQREAVNNWLVFERHAAERTGRVPKSDNLHQHVAAALEALIGPEECEPETQSPERVAERAKNLAAIRAAKAAESAAAPSSNSPPPDPPSPDCHNCHTSPAAMTPENPAVSPAPVAVTPCPSTPSATPAAASSTPFPLSSPPKNPSDMTVPREPWEDEYDRLIEERKTIRLPMGAVVRS